MKGQYRAITRSPVNITIIVDRRCYKESDVIIMLKLTEIIVLWDSWHVRIPESVGTPTLFIRIPESNTNQVHV